jgi:hypothetical protein
LAPIEPRDLVGLWKGRGIPAGHPFDGVLENLGWFGKRFTPDMRADALLFRLGSASGRHRSQMDTASLGAAFARARPDACGEKPVFLSSAPASGEGAGRFAEDEGVWRNREFGDGL